MILVTNVDVKSEVADGVANEEIVTNGYAPQTVYPSVWDNREPVRFEHTIAKVF